MKNKINIRILYLKQRIKDLRWEFTDSDIAAIDNFYRDNGSEVFYDNAVLNFGKMSVEAFENKGVSDRTAIDLWNEIFHDYGTISTIDKLKDFADKIVDKFISRDKRGIHMYEKDAIEFVTAFSSSSFLGIQNPSRSSYSMKSMIKTLNAHANPRIINKPWLLDNLNDLDDILAKHPQMMERHYGDICLNAKMSSASVRGFKSYRDYVLEHNINRILDTIEMGIEFAIFAGVRLDRRAKYRLICSFHAAFRVIDFLINNGSYDICSHKGPYGVYTTEGFNAKQMWEQMALMSPRDDYSMICLDYSGYDTQIGMDEYLLISEHINKHRMHDIEFIRMFELYRKWMVQPKPLIQRSGDGIKVVMDYYRTLPSGMHGTHSFENLIGISTYRQAGKLGIRTNGFWTNGDDQNIFVYNEDIDKYVDFINEYFDINWKKSLIGHKLSVWGKLWSSADIHPIWEIGTFRSIWEKEGGSSELVEESKFMNNYAKIIQVLITLIRMGKPDYIVRYWADRLAEEIIPKVDVDRIPVKLQHMKQIVTSTSKRGRDPEGLRSSKDYLMGKTFNFTLLGTDNYYDMLNSMYSNREYFSLEPGEISYFSTGTTINISSGTDYSHTIDPEVPFMLSKLIVDQRYTDDHTFVRDILQATNSYDGPVEGDYYFNDMISLAHAINDRNCKAWNKLVASV